MRGSILAVGFAAFALVTGVASAGTTQRELPIEQAVVQRINEVRAELERNGIGTGVYYPLPIHLQPPYRDESGAVSCPQAERAALEMFSIPVHPSVSDSDRAAVADELNRMAAVSPPV